MFRLVAKLGFALVRTVSEKRKSRRTGGESLCSVSEFSPPFAARDHLRGLVFVFVRHAGPDARSVGDGAGAEFAFAKLQKPAELGE